jgi:hypothetical protein
VVARGVDADGRKRQRAHLPFLSDLRLRCLLGGRRLPGYVAVAIGNFADPNFPAPTIAVWEESRPASWPSLAAVPSQSFATRQRGNSRIQAAATSSVAGSL